MIRRVRTSATDRVGDAIGSVAAVGGTVALHLFMFGGDEHFALRFLLTPVGDPIAFVAFLVSVVFVVVAFVRAARTRAWSVLRPPSTEEDVERLSRDVGPISARAFAAAVPGAVTRRALKTAAVVAAVNSLFMIVFVIAVIPIFLVIFAIAAALIASMYIVLRSRESASLR